MDAMQDMAPTVLWTSVPASRTAGPPGKADYVRDACGNEAMSAHGLLPEGGRTEVRRWPAVSEKAFPNGKPAF